MTRTRSRCHRLSTLTASTSQLVTQLCQDWQVLHVSTPTCEHVRSWSTTSLTGATSVGDVLDLIDAADSTDEILSDLLQLHRGGDRLAGRVLLQAMLPALLNRAGRVRMPVDVDGFDGAVQVAVTAFWIVLDRLSVTTKVAQRLVFDTVHEMSAWSRYGAQKRWEDHIDVVEDLADIVDEPADLSPTGDQVDVDPTGGLLELIVWAKTTGALSDVDAQLLADAYLSEAAATTADHALAADRAGITIAASRKRLTRARQRLTEAVRAYVAADTGAALSA